MGKEIIVDPITRLEGHGKIHIFLNDSGNVEHAYFQVPEFRGFEKFSEGRPCEAMPQITPRICGVCPSAHHMASTKALDDLYRVEPPRAARMIREVYYCMFMVEDHALHFYFLGGPDFVVGPAASKAERNILGVLGKVGLEVGKKVIGARKLIRDLMTRVGGKTIHPVFGLPGGISKPLSPDLVQELRNAADQAVEFGLFSLQVFRDIVLKNKEYVDLITSDTYTHKTYYMGLVDDNNHVNFYDGMLRVVDPDGREYCRFTAREYLDHVSEHVEPWSYIKFPFLKKVGWKGFTEGNDSGVYAVAPLARLNAGVGMSTPKAQEAYEEYMSTLGGNPVHYTLANHWARLVELLNAAERWLELVHDPDIACQDVRTIPTETPTEGVGVVEAPRGTLFHHYGTDEKGIITKANLIVATQNNAARMAMGIDKAAKALIKDGNVDDGILNMVEMTFRAYDPCHACGTHSLPGQMPLLISIRNSLGEEIKQIRRDRAR